MNTFTFEVNTTGHQIWALASYDAGGGYYECSVCHKRCYCVGYGAPEGLVQFQNEICEIDNVPLV